MPQFRRFANPILSFHKSRLGANEAQAAPPPGRIGVRPPGRAWRENPDESLETAVRLVHRGRIARVAGKRRGAVSVSFRLAVVDGFGSGARAGAGSKACEPVRLER